ncbi:hypothetical protein [Streptomyces sp. NPDC093071]|uniref:hypothetical protein n=1 Tax=Streptomyces sp. NPDC093071 TaxID=3366022 RepID=UPI0037FF99C6
MSDGYISFGIGVAAQAAASLVNTKRQISAAERARTTQHEFERNQSDTRFGRELQLEAVRHQRQFDLRHLESGLRREESLEALGNQTLYSTYPVPEGPGHLRAGLHLLAEDLSDLPPLLLLPRFSGLNEPHWAGLRTALSAALRHTLGNEGLVELHDGLGALTWPHAGLYWNDLYGVPTFVAQVSLYRDTLDLSLGGCHLGTGTVPTEPLRLLLRHRRQPPGTWTEKSVARLNAEAPEGHELAVPADPEGLNRLEVEVAARAVTAVVTSAVDAYWLAGAVRYRQRFDAAAALLGPAARTDWPADLGVSLDRVADPAYHLLTVARRLAARGRPAEAVAALERSLAILAHPDYTLAGPPFPPPAETLEHLADADPRYTEALRETIAAVTEGVDGELPEGPAAVREALDDH